MLSNKILTIATIASVLTLGIAREASAWMAVSIGDNKYAIVCADGHAYTYNGSSAGLGVVGPVLCPGGIVLSTPVGDGQLGPATTINPSKVILSSEARVANGFPTKTTVGNPNKVLTRTNVVLPKGITRGISANVDLAVLQNRKELGDPGIQSVIVAYPPHGYPCLGCHPCVGNTTQYCDDETNSRVVVVIGLPVTHKGINEKGLK